MSSRKKRWESRVMADAVERWRVERETPRGEKRWSVYRLTCRRTGLSYVGKTGDVERRLREHRARAEARRPEQRSRFERDLVAWPGEWDVAVVLRCFSEREAYEAERRLILEAVRANVPHYNRSMMGPGLYDARLRGKLGAQVRGAKRLAHLRRKGIQREVVAQKRAAEDAAARAVEDRVRAEARAALLRRPPPRDEE